MEIAQRAGSSDAVGRAYRGLANCTAIRGHYPESLNRLSRRCSSCVRTAKAGGDVPVVAGVLARIVELENVLGRYGGALTHGAQLRQLTTAPPGADRASRVPAQHAEGFASIAETLAAVGLDEEAGDAARQAADWRGISALAGWTRTSGRRE